MLPRVTEIIKAVGLMPEYDSEDSDFYKTRGTLIHEACALIDRGEPIPTEEQAISEPYVEQWVRFCRERRAEFTKIEESFENIGLGFRGTPDRVGYLDGDLNQEWILDIKTGSPAPWHGVQLAAYVMGTGLIQTKRATVLLSPQGYRFREQKDWHDFVTVKAMLTIYHRRREWNLL